jgi:hypothetical protein
LLLHRRRILIASLGLLYFQQDKWWNREARKQQGWEALQRTGVLFRSSAAAAPAAKSRDGGASRCCSEAWEHVAIDDGASGAEPGQRQHA